MRKYDVIHKTGNAQRTTTPPEEDRATALGNKKLGEDLICSSRDMITDRQTD